MGGPPVTVNATRPGQKARLLFSGTASQRVSLNTTNPSGTVGVTLNKPDGSLLSTPPGPWSQGGPGFIGPFPLPTTETAYAVMLLPGAGTAGATFTLYNVPPDVTGTLTINGGAVPVTITVPGQMVSLTFTGTAGQVVSVRGDGNTIGCGNFGLKWPNGALSTISPCTTTFAMTNATLMNGTHTLYFDPSGTNTGSVNLSVTQP